MSLDPITLDAAYQAFYRGFYDDETRLRVAIETYLEETEK